MTQHSSDHNKKIKCIIFTDATITPIEEERHQTVAIEQSYTIHNLQVPRLWKGSFQPILIDTTKVN
jgi:hypothetical protein